MHRITKSSSTCFHGDDRAGNGVSFDNYIPNDLTREILMRLPAKSIVRFRCVSKLWWSISTEQDFINLFATRQSSILRQSLLLTFMAKDDQQKQVFCMLSFHENSTSYSDVNNFYIMPPTKDCQHDYYNPSVNGLVTFKTETGIVIWNPTMKEHITLLQPKSSECLRCFLGYDPKENTYKILSIAYFYNRWEIYQKPKIFTLGSQESWRVITNSLDHYPSSRYYCINGVFYYRAYISYEEDHKIYPPFINEIELAIGANAIIMSFDVRSEQFKSIQLPARAHQYESKLDESLMTYQGNLAWVCYNSNMIKLWVLQDVEKQEWSKNEFVLPLPQRDLLGSAKLSGATSTGGFIYVSEKLFKDIFAFYYDPVRETITSVNGLEYEKFRSCYGSSNDEMAGLRSYPNHFESLMSLRNIMCSPIV